MNPAPSSPPEPTAGELGVTPESPWLGLRSFTESVRGYFFGRDRELQELYERVLHRPLTVLFGQSGLGKTSILRAGLIPRLRTQGWHPVLIRLLPDETAPPLERQVLGALQQALRLPDPPSAAGLWQFFHDPALGFVDAHGAARFRPVLIFDQFEELFTYGEKRRPADVHAFLEALACLVENRPPAELRADIERDDALADRLVMGARPCKVLLTLRDDFLHALERSRRRMPSLMENRLELRLLAGPQAFHAVFAPGALRCRHGGPPPIIAPDTARAIVRFVAGVAADVPPEEIDNVPPLLSLVCEQLNARRLRDRADTISREALDASAPDVLRGFYEGCLAPHPAAVRNLVEDKLLSDSGFRESVTLDTAVADLRRAGVAEPDAVLRALVDRRLLVMEERGGVTRVEFTHDVLAPIAAASRAERQARVAQAAAERRLAEQRRKARQRRVLVTVMVLLTLASLGGSLLAWHQTAEARRASEHAERETQRAQELATNALTAEARSRDLLRQASMAAFSTGLKAWQEDWEAERKGGRSETLGGLTKWHEAIAYFVRAMELNPNSERATVLLYDTIRCHGREKSPELFAHVFSHQGGVAHAEFSPDGTKVVTASADGTARVWEVATGRAVGQPLRHEGGVAHAEFSPDGTKVVTASADGTARVWEVATGRAVGQPLRHEGGVAHAEFSPDGTKVLTASADGTARVWEVATGRAVGQPLRHEGGVAHAEFSPDGTKVVTASADGTARVWEVATGRAVGQPLRHEGGVAHAEFSPDGTKVVTASADGTARVWEVATGRAVGQPLRHEGGVTHAEFSPDGTKVLTVGWDNAARVWEVAAGLTVGEPLWHLNWVNYAAFNSDGTKIATADGLLIHIIGQVDFSLRGSKTLRQKGSVSYAEFSPDGTAIIVAGVINSDPIRERNLTHSAEMTQALRIPTSGTMNEPLRHTAAVTHATFNPRWPVVVTTSGGSGLMWDMLTGRPVDRLELPGLSFTHTLLSADGTKVAAISDSDLICIWDISAGYTQSKPLRLIGHSVVFSPDGTQVAIVGDDGAARVWKLPSGRPGRLLRHEGAITQAAFSPNGAKVVTASEDQSAQVWDAASGQPTGSPLQHGQPITHVAFSPNGTWIVTAGGNMVRVWEAATGQLISIPSLPAENITNTNITSIAITHVAFSSDGTKIVAGTKYETYVWDIINTKSFGKALVLDGIFQALSLDGRRIATRSLNVVYVRDTSDGHLVGEPLKHDGLVNSAEFSANGTKIVTASEDGTARVWGVPPKAAAVAVPSDDRGIFEWLNAVAGMRLDQDGELVAISLAERLRLRETAALPPGPWAELARWMAEQPGERTLSVDNPRKLTELAERERDAGTREGLLSALDLNPAVPLARLLLANLQDSELATETNSANDAGRIQNAWLRRYDLDRLPATNALLWLRAAEILLQMPHALVGIGAGATNALHEARLAADRGLENARNFAVDPAADSGERLVLAETSRRVGDAFTRRGLDWERVLNAFSLTEQMVTNLSAAAPPDLKLLKLWPAALAGRGTALNRLLRPSEAVPALQKAVELAARGLPADQTEADEETLGILRSSLWELTDALYSTERKDEALQQNQRLLTLGGWHRPTLRLQPALLAGQGRWNEAAAAAQKWVDLEASGADSPVRQQNLPEAYLELSWHRLFSREFPEALAAAEAGRQMDGARLSFDTNRAHALLFLGRTAEAEALYRGHVGQSMGAGEPRKWEEVILDDFNRLEAAGITHPEFTRLRGVLSAP